MNKFISHCAIILIAMLCNLFLSGCVYQDSPCPEDPLTPVEKERLILIYAVAANNLETNLKIDMNEILSAGKALDLKSNILLVYSVDNTGQCTLKKLDKNNRTGNYEFVLEADFEPLPLSTSEERIHEVLSYVAQEYDYPYKGLVLWSHADGWLPWFGGSTPSNEKRKSYGWDNYEGKTYKTNINALANAIPDDVFDFIWFDCCYMANIETIYEIKNKAETVVGSVLEVANDGMPYDITMPYLLRKEPNLREAAFQFFSYYDKRNIPVSVSIVDTDQLPELASISRQIFNYGIAPTQLTGIQTYQRQQPEKFYDMGQLLDAYTGLRDEIKEQLEFIMNKTVTYKLISSYDFNNRPVNIKDYSGLSMHYFIDNGSANNEFYKELDWYQDTRIK